MLEYGPTVACWGPEKYRPTPRLYAFSFGAHAAQRLNPPVGVDGTSGLCAHRHSTYTYMCM